MKTIEERAKEKYPYPINNMQMAYIQGAQEQHDIDIQRAREWLEQNLFGYQWPTQSQNKNDIDKEKILLNLTKALKGE